MKIASIILTIVVTAIYLIFTITKVFILKKQKMPSSLDLLYFAFMLAMSSILCIYYGIGAVLIIMLFIIIWAYILDTKLF